MYRADAPLGSSVSRPIPRFLSGPDNDVPIIPRTLLTATWRTHAWPAVPTQHFLSPCPRTQKHRIHGGERRRPPARAAWRHAAATAVRYPLATTVCHFENEQPPIRADSRRFRRRRNGRARTIGPEPIGVYISSRDLWLWGKRGRWGTEKQSTPRAVSIDASVAGGATRERRGRRR